MNILSLPAETLTPPALSPPVSLLTEGGINLFYGDRGLSQLSTLLTGWRLAKHETVLVLDGDNRFDVSPLIQFAKEIDRDADDLLKTLSISRALTCSQMESLVFKQLRLLDAASRPSLIVLDAPLETFYDKELPFQDTKALLGLLIRSLQSLSPGCTIVIHSPSKRSDTGRQSLFLSYLKTCAHRIFETNLRDDANALCLSEERPGKTEWQIPLHSPLC